MVRKIKVAPRGQGMNDTKRRRAPAWLIGADKVLALPPVLHAQAEAQGKVQDQGVLVEVWKSPTCGCCQGWITHIKAHGRRALRQAGDWQKRAVELRGHGASRL